jgi:hypothetical protein
MHAYIPERKTSFYHAARPQVYTANHFHESLWISKSDWTRGHTVSFDIFDIWTCSSWMFLDLYPILGGPKMAAFAARLRVCMYVCMCGSMWVYRHVCVWHMYIWRLDLFIVDVWRPLSHPGWSENRRFWSSAVCVCVRVYIYIYIYIYIHIYMTYIYIYTYIHIYMTFGLVHGGCF